MVRIAQCYSQVKNSAGLVTNHEPFLGENDDWRACLQRVTARQPR